ncbi:MAG: tRNA dihydrouridine synthase DusB [Marinilabiliales bacterium]|nr:MAG: tRNA dihydrouridine synthase DusB [Marinilabiliales bacterium]
MINLPGITDIKFPVFLAPMEDVTDKAFRKICLEMGADLAVSEFIASEALVRNSEKSFLKMEKSYPDETLVVQIFGNSPDVMADAAQMVEESGAAILDLNFGCPVKKIVNKGGGAALLRDLPLMKEITRRVVNAVKIPVTAKTRLGWTSEDLVHEEVALNLQEVGIQALTMHGRTRSQLYAGEADWEKIAEIKQNPDFQIPLIGNGDINSAEKAVECFEKYWVDGIMIGRAAIGDPWLFKRVRAVLNGEKFDEVPSIKERSRVCKQHLIATGDWKNEYIAVLEMRKFYSGYFKGIPGFKPFKIKLMEANSFEEVFAVFDEVENELNM